MDILIKDMEMPKVGYYLLVFPSGRVVEVFAETRTIGREAKAVPVPPHGRLIDADALIAAHEQVCSRSMKFNLDLAPTIIPASAEGE